MTTKVTFRFQDVYKGGPGSGHRGHKGRPGKQGGGLPDDGNPPEITGIRFPSIQDGKDDIIIPVPMTIDNAKPLLEQLRGKPESSDVQPDEFMSEDQKKFRQLNDMFMARVRVDNIKSDLDMVKSNLNMYSKRAWDSRTGKSDPYYNKLATEAAIKADEISKQLDEERANLRKLMKETTAPGYGGWKFKSKGERTLTGSTRTYSHPEHPEWGEVEVYSFGGWSMQRVAARSSVKFDHASFEWSGSNARFSAEAFMRKYFGI